MRHLFQTFHSVLQRDTQKIAERFTIWKNPGSRLEELPANYLFI